VDRQPLKNIIEAALLTAGKPLSMQHLQQLLAPDDSEVPLAKEFVQTGLDALSQDLEGRGIELKLVASGYRLQVRQALEPWIAKLFEEKPPRYSRALLETLALIGYRQPITRAEIEDVRGVSVSSNIIRTLMEREWIKVVGHKDVPGRPSMYGTTKQFLDYFNLQSLAQLPELGELMDLEKASAKFDGVEVEEEVVSDAANDEEQDAEQQAEIVDESDATTKATAELTATVDMNAVEEANQEEAGFAQENLQEEVQGQIDGTESAEENEVAAASEESEESADSSEGQGLGELDDNDADDEAQEDIDADVDSLIRMLDSEVGAAPSPEATDLSSEQPQTSADEQAPADDAEASIEEQTESGDPAASTETEHEAARGESITPADLLRRHSIGVDD